MLPASIAGEPRSGENYSAVDNTAAFWLMWRIQQEIPKATAPNTTSLATAEFTTLRVRLLKVAARVIKNASRIRVAFASA